MIEKAIKKINPNAEFTINADDINQITWLNGTPPIPKQQILDLIPECLAEIEAKEQAKINAKASALAKLKALGLTEEEVKSIL